MHDKDEPSITPLGQLAGFIAALLFSVFAAQLLDFRDKPKEMPFELREAAANCILTSDPKDCATYERAKPDWPIRP